MPQRDKAISIVKSLRDHGYEAYLAGGCVRDYLLGREPQDYDIATDAKPEAVTSIFPQTVRVGTQFGVILVILDGESFEVATFRFDGPYLDGRHPSHVRFASLKEDITRRDFTINGMMYDPMNEQVLDLVGGRTDLSRRLIRAIGDPGGRFEEDRLRMIRAIRFAASLGFDIDGGTLEAIRGLAPTIRGISSERIGEEITRILTEGGADRGVSLLDTTGLLGIVLPEIEAMKGVEQSCDFHPEGDVFAHTLLMLGRLRDPTETLAYGCLLHDVAKPTCVQREQGRITFYGHAETGAEMATEILKRLRRSRAAWERVAYLVRNHLRHTQAPKMRLSTLKRFLGEDGVDELLDLARIDALSANGDLGYYFFCKRKLAELREEEIHPEPVLRGKDLIALGFAPGPIFQKILRQVEEAQLEGDIASKEEAIAWLTARYKP